MMLFKLIYTLKLKVHFKSRGFAKFFRGNWKMVYTVGEMAKLLDIPASTLRYYDKEGLLPFVERSSGGIHLFRESDFEWL